MPSLSQGPELSTLDEYKHLLKTQWTRPVACQNQCEPPESCSCQRHIVHVDAMKQWWRRKTSETSGQTKLQRLLEEMPLPEHRTFPLTVPKLMGLFVGEHSCLTVFSLLVKQDRGHLIDRFHDSDMNDKYLAIVRTDSDQSLRDNLRHSKHRCEVDTILKEFHDEKWTYCPLELGLHMNRNLHGTRVIPPFCRKIKMGDKGGTASIYWVAVEKDLIRDEGLRLAINDSLYDDPDHGECFQMVLKSYCGNKKSVYDLEKEAFTGLTSNDQVPIVRYLGCYTHDYGEGSRLGKTYNLLLECGERDLYQAWADETNVPPVRAEEIIRFWKSLFGVAEAIRHVHNIELPRHGTNAPLRYIGWHADIKPDNILIVRGRLKLADFGYSRFAPVAQRQDGSVATELINGFTDTYGAPEVSRMKQPDGTTSGVTQSIDTWSLGCVLSVAATWVVLGFQGVRQFEQLRQLAPPNKRDAVTYDRFHDGINMLPEIRKWHNYLRGHVRPSDTATPLVLDLIENNMLQTETSNRFELEELCDKLQEILDWATERVKGLKVHSRKTDSVVLQALYDIEQKAYQERSVKRRTTPLNQPTIPVNGLSTLNPLQRATMQVQKELIIQNKPLGQTPYRREILEQELKDNIVIKDDDDVLIHGFHNGGFTESPTHALPSNDRFDITRKKKLRNPDHHPLPTSDPASTAQVAMPTAAQHPQGLGRSTQHPLHTTNQLAYEQNGQDQPTSSASSSVMRGSSLIGSASYEPKVHSVNDGILSPPLLSPQYLRPSLSLDTPNDRSYTSMSHYQAPVVASPATPVETNEKSRAASGPYYTPTVVVSAPNGTSPSDNTQQVTSDASRSQWHVDSPQWKIDGGHGHADGVYMSAMPYLAETSLDHGHDTNPPITASQAAELASRNTSGRHTPIDDATEKQAVTNDSFSGLYAYEPLPASVLHLPYDVCSVRREVDQGDPKGKRARIKGIFGIEERKADKGLTQTYGDGREIIFVVDNGATMFEHWPVVVFVAETMVKRAAGLDRNGVDLRFTIAGNEHNKYRLKRDVGRREFRAALDAAAPDNTDNNESQTDMFATLDEIVQNWKDSGKPATTLLILTDGKWRRTMQNLVDDIILRLAEEATSKHVGKRTFGIQFIRFGEDCAEKLRKLDNELCKTRGFRDIVDHCSWRSTVEKMFKGSIDGQYDQHDPTELPITYHYQDLVDLFRDFNNNSYHDENQPSPTNQLLSPTSPSRMSLSRSSSRGSNSESHQRKRETMPLSRTESWRRHSRLPSST